MSSTQQPDQRPCISVGLSIRRLKDEAVLLLPDRDEACVLNTQAVAILDLCDGTRTTPELIVELQARFQGDGATIHAETLACLKRLRDLKILT